MYEIVREADYVDTSNSSRVIQVHHVPTQVNNKRDFISSSFFIKKF